jgi:hypothetical protein
LWRCGDGLFFEIPPMASDAFLTTLHPLLENVLQTVDHFEISCLRAPFSWLEKPRNLIWTLFYNEHTADKSRDSLVDIVTMLRAGRSRF